MRPASSIANDDEPESKSTRELMIEILRTVKSNEQRMKTYKQSIEFVHSELEAQKAEMATVKREND